VAADENWADPLIAPTNFQFTDLTVVPGVTLTVASGTVIRCTGTFTNNGTVDVLGAAVGADRDDIDAGTIEASVRNASPGIGLSPAGSREAGPATSTLTPGEGADAISETTARQLVTCFYLGFVRKPVSSCEQLNGDQSCLGPPVTTSTRSPDR
jgi:hypothetical protein